MKLKTILYVDDEEDQRSLVRAMLEPAGYRVRTAGSVGEALSIAFGEFPDLVITDVMMPGESGYSLCTRLKADPSTADIPILVLTILEDESAALEAGATAFLSKPIEAASLVRTIAEILKPTSAKETLDLALKYLRSRDRASAEKALQEVLQVDPDSALAKWARYYLAQIKHLDGDTPRAIQIFLAVLDKDPAFWRAHNRLGLIFEMEGDHSLALKHYQRSLALNTNQPNVWERIEAMRAS